MKKILVSLMALALSFGFFTGCSSHNLPIYDQMGRDGEYNHSLFYRNDLKIKAADPSVIYITDGEQAGYFYMYATSDEIGATGYMSWRSKDLANWETMGVAFNPSRDSWALRNYWAPEVIYSNGKYYMYYNAMNMNLNNRHCLGLAVAENPQGPFVQWTGKNAANENITLNDPIVNFAKLGENHPEKNMAAIDASPFIDENGDIYLYFVRDLNADNAVTKSSIWGMKMLDMATPDYSTLTQLTECGFDSVNGAPMTGEGNVNEAPFMTKHNGKYYLTLSVNSFWEKSYSVVQAIADSPLGAFKKVALDKGGVVLEAETHNNHMSGTGHHSFINVGNETFIAYHGHLDRKFGGGQRGIAVDKIMFVNNGEQDIIHSNGPTWSIMPLPEAVSGYSNVAKDAKINVSGSNSNSAYLNDGIIRLHDYSVSDDFKADKGKIKIDIEFNEPTITRAILIYNTWDYSKALTKVDSITFEHDLDGKTNKATIKDLKLDKDFYMIESEDIFPAAPLVAEFNELKTKKITIEFKADSEIAISDIVVLGKKA